MDNERFLVIRKMKDFILKLDKILIHYPRSEYFLKDKILSDSYLILEYMIETNNKKERQELQIKIISKLSMLDFYFEKSYKNKYISEKVFHNYLFDLENITKMVHGWIHNDGSKSK